MERENRKPKEVGPSTSIEVRRSGQFQGGRVKKFSNAQEHIRRETRDFTNTDKKKMPVPKPLNIIEAIENEDKGTKRNAQEQIRT